MNLGPILIVIGSLLSVVMLQASFGEDNSAAITNKALKNFASHQNNTLQQKQTPTIINSKKPIKIIQQTSLPKADFTNTNFNILFANPDGYFNSTVYFTGKVFSFPGPGELQMYVGDTTNYAVIIYDESFTFAQDDCVKVTGRLAESFEGTNAFGAVLTAPEVKANTIDKINCADAINPAAKIVTVEKTQTRAGIKFTLHKVEFSDKNTRAYVTIENLNGKTGIKYYDFDSKAIQGKKQYSTTYSYDVEYPSIKSDIPAGIEEDGVVLFEPVNYKIPSPVKFQFQATRDDTYSNYDFFYTIGIPK